MSETASKSYVDSEILKHENKWVERTNKMKDNLSKTIQEDRHSSKNRDHEIMLDVHDNKENIALHNQSQSFMQEKVNNIEKHLAEGIADIKQIIKEQAETFATKAEHKENSNKINWLIKVIWTFWIAIIIWWGSFIFNFITTK